MKDPIHVTVWSEFRHEKQNEKVAALYPEGIHGALADPLRQQADFEVRTATLYTKSHTVLAPDYDYRRTDDWIVFPWSAQPPVEVVEAAA